MMRRAITIVLQADRALVGCRVGPAKGELIYSESAETARDCGNPSSSARSPLLMAAHQS
jgi:hypothetical protein